MGCCPIVYGSSKGALDQITRCMAVELGPHNIRVNSVNPVFTPDTHMAEIAYATFGVDFYEEYKQRIPLKRFAKVDDCVRAVFYLASHKSDMINGAFLPVDGGYWCT